jgi:hypothetical protein
MGLVAILLLRQLVTYERGHNGLVPLGNAAPHISAAPATPLHEQRRIVSTRERADAIARAQVWREPPTALARATLGTLPADPSHVECQFHFTHLGGSTPKFDCRTKSGKELRIKYGSGLEIPAEAAATRLLSALGFGADDVALVAHLRCFGCPSEPYYVTKVTEATNTRTLYERMADDEGAQDFEWVSVEQKFPARPIETDSHEGWAFFELDSVNPAKGGAPRAHVDALRLLAVFLAHWDNKAENQRLVCLSDTWDLGTPCPEPFLMLQDVGSTFGPDRVDLHAWANSKIWEDRAACKITMAGLPYGGGTFGPTRISERGRRFLAKQLTQLSDSQLTDLFTWARFDQPRRPLMQTSPVAEWVRVFKSRTKEISDGPPCPDV